MFLGMALVWALTAIADTPTGSISGIVQEVGSGKPIAASNILLIPGGKSTQTDESGHYQIGGVPPGTYTIRAYSTRRGPHGAKSVSLASGQDLTVDFHLSPKAAISGRIIDENGEPVPLIGVYLVAREYRLGALRYVYAGYAETDDRGEYTMPKVEPGRGFLIVAKKDVKRLNAISEAPTEPKLRKKVWEQTWYPDTDSIDGAQVLVLRPGEHREGVDIRMMKSASYCMDGVLTNDHGSGAVHFWVEEQEPTSGESGDGGMYVSPPSGVTGPDGRIRICDLHTGTYRVAAFNVPDANSKGGPIFFGDTEVAIGDRDVHEISVAGHARIAISGEVVWDGKPPDQPVPGKLRVWLMPMTRVPLEQEYPALNAESAVPGNFTLDGVLIDDYLVRILKPPLGTYVKDVLYAGLSILHGPMPVGRTVGSDLRIVLGRDGGVVSAKAVDKDGNPLPECNIVLIPANATSDAEIAALLISGQTDQYGAWTSGPLAPGKYFALATNTPVDLTPETIARLSQARSHAQEMDLAPNDKAQVSLSPVGTGQSY